MLFHSMSSPMSVQHFCFIAGNNKLKYHSNIEYLDLRSLFKVNLVFHGIMKASIKSFV